MNATHPSDQLHRFSPPEEDAVHVWSARVGDGAVHVEALKSVLSRDELERAGRFFRPEDRTRYIVAHGFVRRVLAGCLATEPTALSFTTNEFGKPALVQGAAEKPLCFNLTHSREMILCAITTDRQVGVDIEAVKSDLDVMELARSQFASEEIEALSALSPKERQDAFFRLWTRKEAYVKARGVGLSYALDKLPVNIGCTERSFVCDTPGDPNASMSWSLFDLDSPAGYFAAVVVEGHPVRLISHGWDYSLR